MLSPTQQAAQQVKQQLGGTGLPSAPPKPTFGQKVGGAVGSMLKDAYSTLIGTPATRIGQALVAPGILQQNNARTDLQTNNAVTAKMLADRAATEKNPTLKAQYQKQAAALLNQAQPYIQAPDEASSNVSGVDVPAQKTGLAGIEQIGGQALKSASYLYGGKGLAELGPEAGIMERGLQVGKIGAVSGAAGNAGNTMEQGGNFGQVAGGAITGGLTGFGTGAVLGAGGQIASDLYTGHPIFQSSNPLTTGAAQDQVAAANQNYASADVNAAQATSAANAAVQADVGKGGALGNEFGAGIKNLTEANPTTTSTLSQAQLETLNNLKEGKNFQLPDKLNSETNPVVQMSPDVAAKNAGKIADIKNANAVNLTPSDAADLMRELNGSTYKIADGQKVIDQSRIGITKELEQQFAKDFGNAQGPNGETWQSVYQNFKQGVQFRDTLDGIVNFDKNATPLDLIKQTDTLQKALSTPGGEFQIQKVIDEYAKVRGEAPASVLEDLIAKTKEVGKTQEILKTAQTNLKEAIAMAEKGGYGKQFIAALKNPSLAARRLIGPVVAIPATIVLLPYLRKLYKNLTGQ